MAASSGDVKDFLSKGVLQLARVVGPGGPGMPPEKGLGENLRCPYYINSILGLCWGYIGLMENKMETTI